MGDRLGKVRDVVIVYRSTAAPRVIGLVVEIPGRRHVFLSIGRVTSIRAGQVITTGLINVRRFQPRPGEVRVLAELEDDGSDAPEAGQDDSSPRTGPLSTRRPRR